MREKTCCFTGHREIPKQDRREIAASLERVVSNLIGRGYLYFGAGGALGFDTLAAQTVLKLKKKFPGIKLVLVLSCLKQTREWITEDVEEYERIKARADKVVYISQNYVTGCMHKRNRHLMDNSNACICYLTRSAGEQITLSTMLDLRG